jgi:uncharacterized membrane protein
VAGGTQKRRSSALLGWWYLTIGAGFALLGVSRMVVGESLWGVGLRWVIAAGFLLLGLWELRGGRRG